MQKKYNINQTQKIKPTQTTKRALKVFLSCLSLFTLLFLPIGNFTTAQENQIIGGSVNTDNAQSVLVEYPEMPPLRVAYITIDDGPSRNVTPGLLDLFKQEGIHVTFFVLPIRDVEDIYWRIINEGHELGNHSFSHNYNLLYSGSVETFMADVQKAHNHILNNFGYTMTSFRFPGGPFGWPSSVFEARREALREIGYREFAWHVDSRDFTAAVRAMSGQEFANVVLRDVRNLRDQSHVIILFHDMNHNRSTLAAMPYIIDGLRQMGFTFDVVRNFPMSRADREASKARVRAERIAVIRNTRLEQFQFKLAAESLY